MPVGIVGLRSKETANEAKPSPQHGHGSSPRGSCFGMQRADGTVRTNLSMSKDCSRHKRPPHFHIQPWLLCAAQTGLRSLPRRNKQIRLITHDHLICKQTARLEKEAQEAKHNVSGLCSLVSQVWTTLDDPRLNREGHTTQHRNERWSAGFTAQC